MSRQFSSPLLKTHWSRAFLVSGHAQHGLRGLPSFPITTFDPVEAGGAGVEAVTVVVLAMTVDCVCVRV